MWKKIKNFLEKFVGDEFFLSKNKIEEQQITVQSQEPKIKQLKKVNYKKKAKFRS